MGAMGPLRLSDSELDIVLAAARPLAPQERDSFLNEVAARLAGLPQRGDGVVYRTVRYWDLPLNDVGRPAKFG
jgi:hypothetical protein